MFVVVVGKHKEGKKCFNQITFQNHNIKTQECH